MLLIEDDKLVHVDSASDILEHYGVKGMRWGKRKALTKAQKAERKRKIVKAAKIAGGVALAAGGAYAAYKIGKHLNNKSASNRIAGSVTKQLGYTAPTSNLTGKAPKQLGYTKSALKTAKSTAKKIKKNTPTYKELQELGAHIEAQRRLNKKIGKTVDDVQAERMRDLGIFNPYDNRR